MEQLSDDILRQAAAGDIDAFEQIYRTYSSFVYNVAYRMVETKEDAEEITQEVFLIVHRKLNSFMFRSSLKTWVYRITTNCAINFVNKRSKEQKGKVDIDDVLPYISGPNEIRENIEGESRRHQVEQLLGLLNPHERACVVLRNLEGFSYEAIARSLRVNINTVRTRLKRAREKMIYAGKEVVADEL